MNQQSSRLDVLRALPTEAAADKRRHVLSEVVQVFRSRNPTSARESQELGEALLGILPKLTLADRGFLASCLASIKEAPSYLVRQLARDVPSVAVQILSSPLLTEDDVMAAIELGGSERLRALAARPNLSTAAQAAILKAADLPAIEALLQNASFTPPPDLLSRLILRARSDAQIAAKLVQLKLPPNAFAELFFVLKTPERIQITRRLASGETLSELPANVAGEAALIRAARSGDRMGLARGFSHHWKLEQVIVQRALSDETGELLAVLCLGLGISRAVYSTLAILAGPGAAPDPAGANFKLGAYERFSPQGAQRLVLEWQNTHYPALAHPKAAHETPPPADPVVVAAPPPQPRGLFAKLKSKLKKPHDAHEDPPASIGVTLGSDKDGGI